MFSDEAIPERNPTSPNRIMIVDGNKSRFVELIANLELSGVDVYYTNDRRFIVTGAQKFEPDLIVMNLFLGTGTTLQTLRELRGVLKKTRFLLVTNQMTKENIKELMRS